MNNKKIKVVMAGGGTGGHLYPGLAVAKELQRRWSNCEIIFVGSATGIENTIVPKEGYKLYTLPVAGLIRVGRLGQIKSLFLIPIAVLKSFALVLKLKPDVVLGIGGFAAGPFVLAASFFVKQTYVWEPNAHPGFTNRILSRFVKTAFVVFKKAGAKLKSKNIVEVGLPVRDSIVYKPRVSSNKLRVFVFGGSQGARAINQAVSRAIVEAKIKNEHWLEQVDIVHQTGKLDFDVISKSYRGIENVRAYAYIDNMSERYAWADVVFARGGVGSVSEIIATRKASVIVPLPTAAENHQQSNAEVLTEANAGHMVLQKDFTPEAFVKKVKEFLADPGIISQIEQQIVKLQRPNGAVAIADYIQKDLK